MRQNILKHQLKEHGSKPLADSVKDFGLVVIGAHSGQYSKELINQYLGQNILLVEPVPYNFDILSKEYLNKENFFLSKNAVLDVSKKMDFFYIKKESLSKLRKHWATGIGSFDKNHILNHKTKRFKVIDDDIQKEEIEFITFNDLIEKFSINSINKLQLDVEGAEYKILNSIDYKRIEIKEIIFEYKHFDGTFSEGKKLKETKQKLEKNGYILKKIDEENILARKQLSLV